MKKTDQLMSRANDSVDIWLVVKIMVPFWIPIIIRHLIFRVPKKGTKVLTTTHLGLSLHGPQAEEHGLPAALRMMCPKGPFMP